MIDLNKIPEMYVPAARDVNTILGIVDAQFTDEKLLVVFASPHGERELARLKSALSDFAKFSDQLVPPAEVEEPKKRKKK